MSPYVLEKCEDERKEKPGTFLAPATFGAFKKMFIISMTGATCKENLSKGVWRDRGTQRGRDQ